MRRSILQTDFAKWVDQDEQETIEEAPEEQGVRTGLSRALSPD